MKTTTSIIRLALLTLLLSLAAVTATAETRGWDDGNSSTPNMKDLVPRMSSDEAYSERYGFAVDIDGGGHIGIDFTISNLGFGDGHGAAAVRVYMPKQKKYDFYEKVDSDEWTRSKSAFDMTIANTSVKAKGSKSFVLTHKGDVEVELTFTNKTPMWRPGSGQIKVDDGYYAFNLIAPRADVSGRVKIDGKWIDVTGTRSGYGDHVATNVAPFDLGKRFMRFRHSNKGVFVMWREILLTEAHGGRSLTWVIVGYKDKIVFSDPDADIKFAKSRRDSKTGYEVPRAVQIDARSGEDSIRLIMHGKTMKKRDLLAQYGRAAKMVASAVSEPYRYELKGKYQLQMIIGGASATVEGRSHYTIDYLNK